MLDDESVLFEEAINYIKNKGPINDNSIDEIKSYIENKKKLQLNSNDGDARDG